MKKNKYFIFLLIVLIFLLRLVSSGYVYAQYGGDGGGVPGDGGYDASYGGGGGGLCGNGMCNSGQGENSSNCPQDCASSCGDGICNGGETSFTCPQDCTSGCQSIGTSCGSNTQCCSGFCNGSTGLCASAGGGGSSGSYNIFGTVFIDTNGNGVKDSGEIGYNGATVGVQFYSNTTTTSSSGNYSFNNVSNGNYNILLTVPNDYALTTPNPVAVSNSSHVANFGIQFTGYTISGKVFVDTNKNGVQDCVGSCNNGAGDEQNYNGATIQRVGPGPDPSTTTSGSGSNGGKYSFTGVNAGTYNMTLTVPTGYTATTSNPAQRTVGPDATANFGIVLAPTATPAPPTCTNVTAGSSTLAAGGSTVISANGCAPSPTYSWPAPVTVPSGGSAGSNTGGSNPTTTYTAPNNVCSNTTVRQGVTVSNSGGSNSYSTDLTITPKNTLSGSVFVDTAGNNCASGATAYTSGSTITVYTGGSSDGSAVTNGSGAYSLNDTVACGQKTAVISGITGYQVRRVKFDGGSWTTNNLSSYTYGPFDFSSDHTLDFCISNSSPWIQTTEGDIRSGSLTNNVPSGDYTATSPTNPSVCYSSNFAANFGSGACSVKNWVVNDEFSYNNDPKSTNGDFSYSFFLNRARIKNVTINSLPGCSASGDCTTGISNLTTGIYKVDGNLTVTSYSQVNNAHTTILVNGNLTIKSNILVPVSFGSLSVFAAKGNIYVDPSVGESSVSSSNTDLEGIYTAEGSIVLQGGGCSDGATPDKRLNAAGNFVANALKPFAVGGAGSFTNERSLCVNDSAYPSFTTAFRPDFVTQLTDFYKVPLTRWREVNP
ncbi:MAG TPA: SdrD B-like domain-containing protein [Patescibacteria group bacterium]|nr:SdrD B-like domain-containing protein [Patescibacteria group bacterium]